MVPFTCHIFHIRALCTLSVISKYALLYVKILHFICTAENKVTPCSVYFWGERAPPPQTIWPQIVWCGVTLQHWGMLLLGCGISYLWFLWSNLNEAWFIYTVSQKKQDTSSFVITLAVMDQLAKFFHWQIFKKIMFEPIINHSSWS